MDGSDIESDFLERSESQSGSSPLSASSVSAKGFSSFSKSGRSSESFSTVAPSGIQLGSSPV